MTLQKQAINLIEKLHYTSIINGVYQSYTSSSPTGSKYLTASAFLLLAKASLKVIASGPVPLLLSSSSSSWSSVMLTLKKLCIGQKETEGNSSSLGLDLWKEALVLLSRYLDTE